MPWPPGDTVRFPNLSDAECAGVYRNGRPQNSVLGKVQDRTAPTVAVIVARPVEGRPAQTDS